MQYKLLLLATIVLPITAVSGQEACWPGFRGPLRNGVAVDADPPLRWSANENLRWKVGLPGAGASSPIVVGDSVYVTCYSGYGKYVDESDSLEALRHHLVCVDRESGQVIFDRVIPGKLEDEPRAQQLYQHGFATPTPVADGELIYAYFGRAGLFAFDLDGEVLWQADPGRSSESLAAATNTIEKDGERISLRWGTAGSPLIHDGLVIVNCSEESDSFRAYDKRSGALKWKRVTANLEGCATSPIIVGTADEAVIVVVLGGEVWGLEPQTGALVWRVETDTGAGMSPTPVADAQYVYTFGGRGQSHALRFARDAAMAEGDTRVVWKGENADIPSPILHRGELYVVRAHGTVLRLDAETGEVLYRGRLPGRTSGVYSSPVLVGDRLYLTSRKRGTFVYGAGGEFKLLGRNQLDDDSEFNASPAVVGNELYLRSDRFLYCVADG